MRAPIDASSRPEGWSAIVGPARVCLAVDLPEVLRKETQSHGSQWRSVLRSNARRTRRGGLFRRPISRVGTAHPRRQTTVIYMRRQIDVISLEWPRIAVVRIDRDSMVILRSRHAEIFELASTALDKRGRLVKRRRLLTIFVSN
jgi:hypothetical protein